VKRYKYPDYPESELSNPKTIYLFDPAGHILREPLKLGAFTVVTSSPNPRNYQQFAKSIKGKIRYIPVWTWDEIEKIIPENDKTVIRKRFEIFGGIPRYLFSDEEDNKNQLDEAINNLDIKELERSLGGAAALKSISHKVIQYDVELPDYRKTTIKFSSSYVESKVTEKLLEKSEKDYISFLHYSKSYPNIATVRGSMFERYGHNKLPKGGKYTMKNFSDGKVCDIDFPMEMDTKYFSSSKEGKLISNFQNMIYYRPKEQNFEGFDSVIGIEDLIYIFQFTVSETHNVKMKNLKRLVEEQKGKNIFLCFVVPDDIFDKFKEQNYETEEGKTAKKIGDLKNVDQCVLKLNLSNKFLDNHRRDVIGHT